MKQYSRDVTCNVNKCHRSYSPAASMNHQKILTRPLARKENYFLFCLIMAVFKKVYLNGSILSCKNKFESATICNSR